MSAPHRGKVLDIAQASAYIGLSVRRLRSLARTKQIAFVRLSGGTARRKSIDGSLHTCAVGRLGFCEHDLDAYIEQHRTPATADATLSRVATSTGINPLAQFLPPATERRFA